MSTPSSYHGLAIFISPVMSPAAAAPGGESGHVRFIPLSYDNADSKRSAMKLLLTLMPQWAKDEAHLDFVRFTDGITNTLLKAVNRRPGLSKADIDREAILLRAYGNGTDILIDREREAANHELLMKHNLAPELLARFGNGMMYRFIPGAVAQPKDLADPAILHAIARRLAQWHATVPCLPDSAIHANGGHSRSDSDSRAAGIAPGKPIPNLWTTVMKWIAALPTDTAQQRERQTQLLDELKTISQQLSQRPGLGNDGVSDQAQAPAATPNLLPKDKLTRPFIQLVFAHCDLLSANVIIHRNGEDTSVSFIDYEYGIPSPVAFDIANHFAEWAGYDCDYTAVPKESQRQAFIQEYIKEFSKLSGQSLDEDEEVRKLMHEVNVYRGVPGFYWGIWALIQATISHIDFDYATYAESRLGEYWAYKGEADGSRAAAGNEMPVREQTWASKE